MPLDKPGSRRRAVASKTINHATFCVENKFVGYAAKIKQATRFTAPDAASITQIASGEEFTQFLTGVHEIALTGAINAGAVGDRVWIDPTDNSLALDGTAATGDYPLGVIDSIDTVRDTCLISLDNKAAFMAKA